MPLTITRYLCNEPEIDPDTQQARGCDETRRTKGKSLYFGCNFLGGTISQKLHVYHLVPCKQYLLFFLSPFVFLELSIDAEDCTFLL